MKKEFRLLAWISILPFFANAQLTNNGATILITNDAHLVLNDISLHNNGTFHQTAGSVTFTGSISAFIQGSQSPVFYLLNVNKPAGTLQLQTDITVNRSVSFFNGILNMGSGNIILDPAASLIGESESSHITGSSGYIQITRNLNAPVAVNPGGLGAIITSSQNLGAVTIRRGHQSQTNGTGNGNSILRYYDIIPSNNTALNATLRINYLDAELNGLDENILLLWKTNNGANWSSLGRTSGNSTANYVEQTGIDNFARFTLSSPNNALPVIWGSFNTQCFSDRVRIVWKTQQEQNTAWFIIRRSADAQSWNVIGTLAAAGSSNVPVTYTYADVQPLPGKTYYQVQLQDSDGRVSFSPIFISTCGTEESIKVFPNPVHRDCWIRIGSSAAGPVLLRLYDSKGALVQQRRETIQQGLNQFQLHLGELAAGIYSLAVTLPDGTVRIVKIEKY